MDFDELQKRLMPILQEILVLRLVESRSWNNVSLDTGKRHLDVTWQDAKDGNTQTQKKRVQPFNATTLCAEIATQFNKLQRETKDA